MDYTYDYAGNRLTRDIPSSLYSTNDQDQVYTYDGLHRLKDFDEGTLSGTSISGTPEKEQDWTLDQLGNWEDYLVKANGSTTLDQEREHNDVNELTGFTGGGWGSTSYDAAGNMIHIPDPLNPSSGTHTAQYDAWNRLVEVGNTAHQWKYEYDGLNRRIVRDYSNGISGEVTHFYYNTEWQVLAETDPNGETTVIYAYHPHYVDAVATRIIGGDVKYYLDDANYNVTAVADPNGAVIERYSYTPYGEVTVLDPNFTVDPNGSSIDNEYLLYWEKTRPGNSVMDPKNWTT